MAGSGTEQDRLGASRFLYPLSVPLRTSPRLGASLRASSVAFERTDVSPLVTARIAVQRSLRGASLAAGATDRSTESMRLNDNVLTKSPVGTNTATTAGRGGGSELHSQ